MEWLAERPPASGWTDPEALLGTVALQGLNRHRSRMMRASEWVRVAESLAKP